MRNSFDINLVSRASNNRSVWDILTDRDWKSSFIRHELPPAYYTTVDTTEVSGYPPPCSSSPSQLVNELWRDEIRPDDDRHAKWAEQRAVRGFDDTDLWSLDQTIARFLVSRLKAFRDIEGEHTDEFKAKLDDVIVAFELVLNNDDGHVLDWEEQVAFKKGFKQLRKIFFLLFT